MAAFGQMMLTNKGLALQAKAQTGTALQFTAIKIGDGSLGGQAITTLNGLIGQKLSLSIGSALVRPDGKAELTAYLKNSSLVAGFYFREIGVFATDPDAGEILYCYANAGTTAEYIPAGGGPDIVEKYIRAVAIVQNAANVSAIIDSSLANAPLVRTINTNGGLQGGGNLSADRTLSIANAGVTDVHIGSRTIGDSTAPSGDSGTVTTLFGWLANMVKAITGKSNWRTAPATTLEAAATHAANNTVHITSAERTAWNAKASTATATTSASGLMSAADKSKLDGVATAAGTAGSATDTVIGNRSITDTVVAASGADTPSNLWSKLGYMIKAITGKGTWYTAPATTLEAAATHAALTSTAHGATTAATANTIAARDSNGDITINGTITTGNFIAKSKISGNKTWTMHHAASGNLVFAQSATVDAMDWNWSNSVTISPNMELTAKKLTSDGTAVTANNIDMGFKMVASSAGNPYMAAFDNDGATRRGYIQWAGNDARIAAEKGGELLFRQGATDNLVVHAGNIQNTSIMRTFSGNPQFRGMIGGGANDTAWRSIYRMVGTDRSGNGTATSSGQYYDAQTIKGTVYQRMGNYTQAIIRQFDFQFTLHSWAGTGRQDNPILVIPSWLASDTFMDVIRVVKYGINDYELQLRAPNDYQNVSFELFVVGGGGVTGTYQSTLPVSPSTGITVARDRSTFSQGFSGPSYKDLNDKPTTVALAGLTDAVTTAQVNQDLRTTAAPTFNGLTTSNHMRVTNASEVAFKKDNANAAWGFYLNDTSFGLYDWKSSKNVLTYAAATNSLSTAIGTVVANWNADQVDGYHLNQDVRTTASPSFTGITAGAAGINIRASGGDDGWIGWESSTDITNLIGGSTASYTSIKGATNAHVVVHLRANDPQDMFAVVASSGAAITDHVMDKVPFKVTRDGVGQFSSSLTIKSAYPFLNLWSTDGTERGVALIADMDRLYFEPRSNAGATQTSYNYIDLANGQYVNTLPTGTAPLKVSSATVVSNFNSDLLDGQHGSYYAPIASPVFTGAPTAPTAAVDTNTTQLATTQFVQNQFKALACSTASTGASNGNKWTKFGSIRLTAQWQECNILLSVTRGEDGGAQVEGLLSVRIKQQAVMGQAPIIGLTWLLNRGFAYNNMAGTIASNTTGETIVDLYTQVTASYNAYYFRVISSIAMDKVTLFSAQAYVDSVPGTGIVTSSATTLTDVTLAGTPTVPTAVAGTNTTQAASTANVYNHVANYVTLATGADLNTYTRSGFYRLGNNMLNSPGTGLIDYGQMLVIHSAGDTITQIAFNYANARMYVRTGNPSDVGGTGAWTAWVRTLNQYDYDTLFQYANDGKTAVANAITAKGVAASSSDTFATLATKVGQIPNLAIYKLGKEGVPLVKGYDGGSGSITKGASYITLQHGGTNTGSGISLVTDTMVDLTDVTQIAIMWNFNCTGVTQVMISATTLKTANYFSSTYSARKIYSSESRATTFVDYLDVSAVTGNHYIVVNVCGVVSSANVTCAVHKIILV